MNVNDINLRLYKVIDFGFCVYFYGFRFVYALPAKEMHRQSKIQKNIEEKKRCLK